MCQRPSLASANTSRVLFKPDSRQTSILLSTQATISLPNRLERDEANMDDGVRVR